LDLPGLSENLNIFLDSIFCELCEKRESSYFHLIEGIVLLKSPISLTEAMSSKWREVTYLGLLSAITHNLHEALARSIVDQLVHLYRGLVSLLAVSDTKSKVFFKEGEESLFREMGDSLATIFQRALDLKKEAMTKAPLVDWQLRFPMVASPDGATTPSSPMPVCVESLVIIAWTVGREKTRSGG